MAYLTTKAFADEIGVTIRTVERWRQDGSFVPERRTRGGHSRYSEDQVEQFKLKRLMKEMLK